MGVENGHLVGAGHTFHGSGVPRVEIMPNTNESSDNFQLHDDNYCNIKRLV